MKKQVELIEGLNTLLASFQIYYQNLRGFHWNIKGKHFFELHVKFEEWYNDSQIKIDMLAERILMLEAQPLHTFNDYMSHSQISPAKDISRAEESIQLVSDAVQKLLDQERYLLNLSDELEDEGTNSMMSDLISEQEKLHWMLKSWLA